MVWYCTFNSNGNASFIRAQFLCNWIPEFILVATRSCQEKVTRRDRELDNTISNVTRFWAQRNQPNRCHGKSNEYEKWISFCVESKTCRSSTDSKLDRKTSIRIRSISEKGRRISTSFPFPYIFTKHRNGLCHTIWHKSILTTKSDQ